MKTTLQSRLTLLMIIFSVIFILIFSAIQLWSHTQNVDRFVDFKSRHSAFVIKESFKRLFEQNSYDKSSLKYALESLKDLGFLEEALILDEQKTVVAKTSTSYYPSPSKKAIDKAFSLNKPYIFLNIDKYLYGFIKISNNSMACTISSAATIQKALREVTTPILGIIIFVIFANFILASLLSSKMIKPVAVLFKATTKIAGGDLNERIDIKTNDELEQLADNFNFMTAELNKMKQRAENANPLTKLPGNIVIQEEAEKRIKNNEKFVVIYCDLDNFKAFNDKYGVHKGDDAIKLTAQIFREAINNTNSKDNFLGHEGGDDFLLVTIPEHSRQIADYITKEFDKKIIGLYSQEDIERGYIEAKARHTEEIMKFPIMTISLAGITNVHREIKSYAEITNIAAEIKKKAKKTPGSCFVMDKRQNPT